MPIRKKYRIEKQIKHRKKKQVFLFSRNDFFKGLRKRRIIRKVLAVCCLLFAVLCLAGIGIFAWFAKDLPNPDEINSRTITQSTKIYDRTGKILLYEIHGEERRTLIPFEEIPTTMKLATIAIEDKDFYQHHGFDFSRIIKAAIVNLRTKSIEQGASTITQQLIKNSILTPERTFVRKIKELILAIEMERKFSKDEILTMYLNQIPYGSNAYGIEAASQTYFGKKAADLNLPEAALLASLPKSPTYYSPYGSHPEKLKGRYEYVLTRMEELGFINHQEAKEAKEVNILAQIKPFKEKIIAPHFVMYVKEQMVKKYGKEMIEKGGLKIITTLDFEKQKIAEEVVKKGAEKNLKKYKAANASLVAIDPKTGQILAMVGSKDYFGRSFPQTCRSGKNCLFDPNVNVAIRDRQPGSSFKPFVYATAFKKGYTPSTILFDLETNFSQGGKSYIPKNYDWKFRGPVTMRQALAQSLNIPSVKTLYLAGINESIATAHDMGITTLNDPKRYGLSLVLGGGEVKLLDSVAAFSVFAQNGIKHNKTAILRVENWQGKILEEFKNEGVEVLDPQIAYMINDILSDDAARAPMFGARSDLYLKNRQVAAKTGTTDEYRDAWTIGYTPSLVAGVWAGNNDNTPMYKGAGIYAAAPIWHDFMSRVLKSNTQEKFTKPKLPLTKKPILNGKFEKETVVKIDKACGDKLATENTPRDQIEEKIYKEVHNILYYLDKNNPLGDYPAKPQTDPQFNAWEEPVLRWAEENGYNQTPPTEFCPLRSEKNRPTIKIISPKKDSIIDEPYILIKVEVNAPLGVKQVDFFFDETFIGTDQAKPFEIHFNLPHETKDGEHVIKAKIYDRIENMSEEETSFSISLNSGVILKEPRRNGPFYIFEALVTDKKNIQKMIFYAQSAEKDKSIHKIETVNSPISRSPDLYRAVWKNSDGLSGNFYIYAIGVEKNGDVVQSNMILIDF